jgi:hypothetical protein
MSANLTGVALRLPVAFLLVFSSFLGLSGHSSAQPIANGSRQSGSLSRIVFDQGAFFGESEAMPHWEHGYLVSREVETLQEGKANIRMYGSSGTLTREAAVWFPDSKRALLYSVALSADGRIIAAGTAIKADGTSASFIALLDASGAVSNAIQTNTFVPINICVAPDGTVWSFGGNGYQSLSEPRLGDTLHHFDLRKGEIGSYIPRSLLTASRSEPSVLAYIRCSSASVSAYSPRAGAYIEMKYSDSTPRIFRVPTPSSLKSHGFAVTDSKRVYGYFSRPNFGGLYYLSLDETAGSGAWLPVKGIVGPLTQSGVVTGLWGADSENLLVSISEDPGGVLAIHWTSSPNP